MVVIYKTEEVLERNIPFKNLDDRINFIHNEEQDKNVFWDLLSHNVGSKPDKEGKPEIVHYLIFQAKMTPDTHLCYMADKRNIEMGWN